MTVRAKRLLPAVAASVLLLTGCGVQGLQWHPGIAATVGSHSITDKRIDDLTTGYCTAIASQLKTNGNVAPLGVLRSAIVRGLVTRYAVEEVGDQYAVGPDSTYQQAVSQAQTGAAGLSGKAADAYVQLQSLNAYISSVAEAVGKKVLAGEGQTGATSDQETAAGQEAVAHWISTHHIDVSPAYDVQVTKGEVVTGNTEMSFASSSTAKSAAGWLTSQSPDKDYAASLPLNQVCG